MMKVSYAHANPSSGNESFLIRFEGGEGGPTPCILVDSGSNVDVDELLGPNEFLHSILLTHAHTDHHWTLGSNLLDSTGIYTSPGTSRVLEYSLADGTHKRNPEAVARIIDHIIPLSDWKTLFEGVRVRPIPAGHCPGAAGFLIQFDDEGEWRTMVATGDFTLHRSGGYPGFPTDMMVDVEALFLTGATSTKDDRAELLRTTLEQANAGAETLVTATGLSGVELAYLLGNLIEGGDYNIPLYLAGHAAKLYASLDYDVPNVHPVPDFETTYEVMEAGAITIAGPQVPTEGASARLFGTIRNDPNATLIQVTDGSETPFRDAGCTLYDFQHIPHPTEAEVDTVVEELDPAEVVVTHQMGADADRYKDKYSSYVWASNDSKWHLLFDDYWRSPPWVTSKGRSFVRSNSTEGGLMEFVTGDLPLPSLERRPKVELDEEGITESSDDPFSPSSVSAD